MRTLVDFPLEDQQNSHHSDIIESNIIKKFER